MKKQIIHKAFLLALFIPAVLLSACQDKPRVIKSTSENKPWLGIQVEDLSRKMLKNLTLDHGVKIVKVFDNSPAEEAGLETDDILLSFNGEDLNSPEELVDLVRDREIEDEVEIAYLRDGAKNTTTVTLGKTRRYTYGHIFKRNTPKDYYLYQGGYAWLGVRTERLTDQLRQYFGVTEDGGVLITEVMAESPAKEAGLQAGDIIIQVAEKKIKSTRDLLRAINYFDPDDVVEITVIRDKKEQSFKVKLGKTEKPGHIHIFGMHPEDIEIKIPNIDIEIPDIEIDTEEIELLEERIQKELKQKSAALEEKLKSLDDKLKHMKIKIEHQDSFVI